MRYRGGADIDGSCWPWTEVVLWTVNGSNLACYPSPLSESQNWFRWSSETHVEEIKCLYGIIKITTSNHISELLKMQLESRSRNVNTWGTRSGFISTHAVTTRKSIRSSHIGKRAFAFVFSRYKVIIALSMYFSSWALQHTVHISIIAAKIVSLEFFFELQYFGPDLRLARTKTAIPIQSVQNADCRPQTGYNMQTRYKMQTADWVQNAD